MKTLRRFILEIVKASPSYLKKEEIRGLLEDVIRSRVESGDISSQEELDDFYNDIATATLALKSVPYDVFKKIVDDK